MHAVPLHVPALTCKILLLFENILTVRKRDLVLPRWKRSTILEDVPETMFHSVTTMEFGR